MFSIHDPVTTNQYVSICLTSTIDFEVANFDPNILRLEIDPTCYNVRPPVVMWTLVNKLAPVPSSLFAYHKPVRDIGVMFTTNLDIVNGGPTLYSYVFWVYNPIW